jgi:hypothetical protein
VFVSEVVVDLVCSQGAVTPIAARIPPTIDALARQTGTVTGAMGGADAPKVAQGVIANLPATIPPATADDNLEA